MYFLNTHTRKHAHAHKCRRVEGNSRLTAESGRSSVSRRAILSLDALEARESGLAGGTLLALRSQATGYSRQAGVTSHSSEASSTEWARSAKLATTQSTASTTHTLYVSRL